MTPDEIQRFFKLGSTPNIPTPQQLVDKGVAFQGDPYAAANKPLTADQQKFGKSLATIGKYVAELGPVQDLVTWGAKKMGAPPKVSNFLGAAATFAVPLGGEEKALEEAPGVIKAASEAAPGILRRGWSVASEEAPKVFQGFKDLSTNILEKLKGRDVVSKQFISDLTNSGAVKQAERDAIRNALTDMPANVPVKDFANKVKSELLPLKTSPQTNPRYESISLPRELRGNVANYQEKIYNSPIGTSAGDVHFPNYTASSRRAGTDASQNYFAHTRVEDLAPDSYKPGEFSPGPNEKGSTRRVIELQSDLFQKGRMEESIAGRGPGTMSSSDFAKEYNVKDPHNVADYARLQNQEKQISQLDPYRNTWHERVIKEEVKQAAKDGKTKLQFPTGDTAMKIEGLGQPSQLFRYSSGTKVTPENLKVGESITHPGMGGDKWIVTDVLGDGKFKAVPKRELEIMNNQTLYDLASKKGYLDKESGNLNLDKALKDLRFIRTYNDFYGEQFDISGKIDQSNPIYKFYQKDVGKYVQNKYGAKLITDPQGVQWWEVPLKKAQANLPIEAFAALPIVAGMGKKKDGSK